MSDRVKTFFRFNAASDISTNSIVGTRRTKRSVLRAQTFYIIIIRLQFYMPPLFLLPSRFTAPRTHNIIFCQKSFLTFTPEYRNNNNNNNNNINYFFFPRSRLPVAADADPIAVIGTRFLLRSLQYVIRVHCFFFSSPSFVSESLYAVRAAARSRTYRRSRITIFYRLRRALEVIIRIIMPRTF